jgi:hypothetical protein
MPVPCIATHEWSKVAVTMVPNVCNDDTDGAGTGVDRRGYAEVLMIAVQGISGDTLSGSVYWTIKFQECDDNATWTNTADADLANGANLWIINAAAEDPTTIIRLYKGSKRYVRIFWDATGTHTNGTPIAGVCLLSRPLHGPITQTAELGAIT